MKLALFTRRVNQIFTMVYTLKTITTSGVIIDQSIAYLVIAIERNTLATLAVGLHP